uniref:Reverse transcriptase domain-containing protein n=1 Tax=Tanacetum cinerariifolium TaxID=118510 RepID=A0A6L2J0E0_TANCI|nr:reverse transcriptase domain-containing protein [Tanacetum cinerariifolium]
MADQTMEELLQAPTEGYGEAIVILKILAKNFEIKTNLHQLVQTNKFHGFERDNPHTHISNFKRMTSTLKYRDVPNDAIKLMLFPYSLEGAARIWYEKEPPNSNLTWDDLVNKFVNQFFPPSKTTHLKNEISRFTQRFEETFGEAWERFKEMLRACPHHGFLELTPIDTFYNGLNEQDQDSLNVAAGGNLLSKTTREALKIIENKSKVRYLRSKSNVSRVNTNSRESSSKTDDRIDKLADQISNLIEIVNKQVVTPAMVKAVEKSCVIYGGAHDYYDCIATDSNQSSVCAATVTTRSGLAYEGPSIPTNSSPEKVVERETEETTDKEQPNCQGSTAHIQPPVVPISIPEPVVPKTQTKPNFSYPSRLNDQRLREKATNQMEKVAEDVFVKVRKFHFPTDFVVADFEADPRATLILGRSFLRTGRALIDVYGEEITLWVNDESVTFNLNQTMRYSSTYDDNSVNQIDVIDIACEEYVQDVLDFKYNSKSGNPTLVSNPLFSEENKSEFCKELIVKSSSSTLTPFGESDFLLEEIDDFLKDESILIGIEDSYYDPEGDILYLEKLLNDDPSQLPPMDLKQAEETKVKSSIKNPSELELKELPSHLEYAFLDETEKLPVIIAKVFKDDEKEALLKVLKSHKRAISWKITDIKGTEPRFYTHKILMEEDYKPAVQSQRRVNPKIHKVIKKEVIKLLDAGMIYLISDIPKLNDATRIDHFPLTFMDQTLERLAGNEFYCILDGFSGYFQIPIDPQDQEKTTLTCPYRTFAYRRMPFGLCNAPGTFQRDSFSSCLSNLDKMLKRCEDTNLVLNWEKCHFICKEGIVLGHKISKSEIEVDRAKVDARPMTYLLEKETPFVFFNDCIDAFETFKKKLTEAPILVFPDWNLPFELMCDASDFTIGKDCAKITKKQSKPDKIEHEITKNAQKPDQRTFSVHKCSTRRRVPNIIEPEIRTIKEVFPMADRTMKEILQAPTEGYGEAIVIPEILAENFEIKTNLLQVNTNPRDIVSKTDDRIDKLADQISNLVEIVNKQVITPASAKAVEKTCVTYGGAHAYYDCIATDCNQPSVCTATGSYNQVSWPNRASHQIPPPGFAPVQNNPNRYNQNQEPDVLRTQPKPTIPYPSSFADALLLMPKFASTIKSLLINKDKLFELAKVPLNENFSAMLLKKLLEKLRDPELTPTRMTLELADRSITHPKGVAEDVFVKVGKFYFPINFVVVDFKADPRVPLILGRSFLRTDHALIDVYGEEITLRYNPKSSNPTLVSNPSISESKSCKKPIVKSSSPTLTSFRESDFFLEEIEDFLNDELIPTGIDNSFYDPEGDILYLERLLNEDPFQLPLMDLKQTEETKAKSSVEEPPELELKELPSHLDPWVSPIHYMPKKGGMTVVANENNELIPTRLVTGWRVCIDYRKLNDTTRKDHFPLPFMDQKLERLAGNEFYCFLNGHKISKSGIEVDRAKEDVIAKLPHPTTAKDKKGFENLAADHLSRLENPHKDVLENKDINENFFLPSLDEWSSRGFQSWIETYFREDGWRKPCLVALKHVNFDLKTVGNHQKLQLNELNELRDQAYENSVIYKERTKKLHDSKIKNRIFNVGDQVLLFNSRLKIFSGKLKTCWSGPFTITHVFPYGTIELYQPNGPKFKVNGHRVKHYFGGDIPFNVVLDLHTSEKAELSVIATVEANLDDKLTKEELMDKLDDELWAFRTAFKTPIGCTPYKLVYEKSCHLPIELEHKSYCALKHANFDLKTTGDHRKLELNELTELRDQAYENSLIYKERTKKLHESKIKNHIFNVGDQVLLFNSRQKIFLGKLKTRWLGPFTITQVFPYGTVELPQPVGPNFKVNGHRVKHYFGGDIPSKVVPDLHTIPIDK